MQPFHSVGCLVNMITLGNNIRMTRQAVRGRPAGDVPQGNNFGAWLRAKRLARHLTGEALAFAIGGGMTQGRISAYERGHKKPERETVVLLATALGADPHEALEALISDTPGLELPAALDEVSSPEMLYRSIMSLDREDRAYLQGLVGRLVRNAPR